MDMVEKRDEIRKAQASWAEQRAASRRAKIASFVVVSQSSGTTVAHADDAEMVIDLANDYRQNPELVFVGVDEDGREAGSWTIGEVLNGTFEAEIAS